MIFLATRPTTPHPHPGSRPIAKIVTKSRGYRLSCPPSYVQLAHDLHAPDVQLMQAACQPLKSSMFSMG
jgi:hypothetical protein